MLTNVIFNEHDFVILSVIVYDNALFIGIWWFIYEAYGTGICRNVSNKRSSPLQKCNYFHNSFWTTNSNKCRICILPVPLSARAMARGLLHTIDKRFYKAKKVFDCPLITVQEMGQSVSLERWFCFFFFLR